MAFGVASLEGKMGHHSIRVGEKEKKRRRRREKGREYEEGYSHEYRVDLERDLVGLKIDVVEG